jgi:hypothetical protein
VHIFNHGMICTIIMRIILSLSVASRPSSICRTRSRSSKKSIGPSYEVIAGPAVGFVAVGCGFVSSTGNFFS